MLMNNCSIVFKKYKIINWNNNDINPIVLGANYRLFLGTITGSFFCLKNKYRGPPLSYWFKDFRLIGEKMERPKRLKSKDNPYTIGYDEINNIYTIEFKDNKNEIHNIEISKEVYDAFDKFELEDISQMHKYSRHIEHSEIYENNIIISQ